MVVNQYKRDRAALAHVVLQLETKKLSEEETAILEKERARLSAKLQNYPSVPWKFRRY